jgi:hypothetical protein
MESLDLMELCDARNAESLKCNRGDDHRNYVGGEEAEPLNSYEARGNAGNRPVEQSYLLSVLGRSEGPTIVKDAIRLITGRRTKEHLNAILLGATLFSEACGQLLLSFQSRHDIAILTKDDRLGSGDCQNRKRNQGAGDFTRHSESDLLNSCMLDFELNHPSSGIWRCRFQRDVDRI